MSSTAEQDTRDRLLSAVKKEVKQIMEESVTRKFVHEESSTITSLCAAVEACLQNGLKKRALGLFKNSTTTTALLQKLSKHSDEGAHIIKLMNEIDNNNDPNKRSLDSNKNSTGRRTQYNQKYLWIRLALFEKKLAKIIDHLVDNSSKFYEKDALIGDPCDGPLLASLLVGPCALDYTRMKTTDHFWTDPPADELVQRHRIHAGSNHHMSRPESPKRPGLQVTTVKAQIRRHTSSSSEENMRTVPLSAKEYVESLHQNSRSTLLYGKNSVMVQPKEDVACLAGYLSLHQGPEGLTVKWTPNQLMNGCCDEGGSQEMDRSLYWDYAVTVYMDEIVYLHCHQQPDSGGTIVLVGQDGVQRPPIHFPNGGHLLAFLTCLETGLLPNGQLDPPLWAQKGKGKVFPKLKRKGSRLASMQSQNSMTTQKSMTDDMVEEPQTIQASSFSASLSVNDNDLAGDDTLSMNSLCVNDEEEATDYVFRIINTFKPDSLPEEMMDPKAVPSKDKSSGSLFPWLQREILNSKPLSQLQQPAAVVIETIHQYTHSQPTPEAVQPILVKKNLAQIAHGRAAVRQLCDTMKKQIISRAFYGWLAHCRHLKTVRTHLSGLVNTDIAAASKHADAADGLTVEAWQALFVDGVVTNEKEVDRLVYYGGCAHEIRKQVWPYLLGHYTYGSTPDERTEVDEDVQNHYEITMSQWLAVEAIVRQRDKETMAANLAKLSSESQDHGTNGSPGGHIPLMRKDSSLSNDVFESVDADEQVLTCTTTTTRPDPLIEESGSSAATSPNLAETADIKIEHTIMRRNNREQTASDGSKISPDEGLGDSLSRTMSSDEQSQRSLGVDRNIIVTNPSMDSATEDALPKDGDEKSATPPPGLLTTTNELLSTSRDSLNISAPPSPASVASNGGIYSVELLDNVALNLHRIDKDVQRCDRNYYYFTPANLDKLRNIMCTYVWEHLDVGYVQGMCDLVAPLLVIFDDEAKSYSCFEQLMKRMMSNFPHGGAMDTHFANMRSLIQILDAELFEHMHQNGDYTHFYFCYRWFLLDFKRELVYDDVFSVWETIWAARRVSSSHFVLFIALALVEYYREIILDNNMDFTDIIKFFNEMAERHNAKQVLSLSRDLVYKLQDLIENK